MQFAVNYSPALAALVSAGQVKLDRFKCPAWPGMITEAAALRPVYVHCPLEVGWGRGVPFHSERKQALEDLGELAELLSSTGTPLVNTHLMPGEADFPAIPADSMASRHIRQVVDATLRDLEPLIQRFGAENVIVENCIGDYGRLHLSAAPEIFHLLLEKSGCGFLFDQSHARLAARQFDLPERVYIESLPLDRMREMHVTGLVVVEGAWLERILAAGDSDGFGRSMAGQTLDHFPMQPDDWSELDWAVAQIRSGAWQEPWVMAFEYGGVGGFFQAVTDHNILAEQVPHMADLING